MKKIVKLVTILMILMMTISLTTPVFAAKVGDYDIVIEKPTSTSQGYTDVMDIAEKVLGYIQWIAIIGGVIIISILGVKYMMGSLEEKADYKKSMIPLIVGILIVMAATTIANFLVSIV